MKNKPSVRFLGLILIIIGVFGLIFSMACIGFVWFIRPKIESSLIDTTYTINETLKTTGESLSTLSGILEITKSNLGTIELTIENLDGTLGSVSNSLDTTALLIGDDLLLAVDDIKIALGSAATSAELIDNTLFFLASIPFIGVDYQPDVPLHISLLNFSDNLDEIPKSLESMEQTLGDAADGLDLLNANLQLLTGDMQLLQDDLLEAQGNLADYLTIIEKTETKVGTFSENIDVYSTFGAIIITGFIFFLGVSQLSILLHGLHYFRSEIKVVSLSDIQRDRFEK